MLDKAKAPAMHSPELGKKTIFVKPFWFQAKKKSAMRTGKNCGNK